MVHVIACFEYGILSYCSILLSLCQYRLIFTLWWLAKVKSLRLKLVIRGDKPKPPNPAVGFLRFWSIALVMCQCWWHWFDRLFQDREPSQEFQTKVMWAETKAHTIISGRVPRARLEPKESRVGFGGWKLIWGMSGCDLQFFLVCADWLIQADETSWHRDEITFLRVQLCFNSFTVGGWSFSISFLICPGPPTL